MNSLMEYSSELKSDRVSQRNDFALLVPVCFWTLIVIAFNCLEQLQDIFCLYIKYYLSKATFMNRNLTKTPFFLLLSFIYLQFQLKRYLSTNFQFSYFSFSFL
jgi:hypothetical protein